MKNWSTVMTKISTPNPDVSQIVEAVKCYHGVEVVGIVQLKTVFGLMTIHGKRLIWKPVRDGKLAERLLYIMPVLDFLTSREISHGGPIRTIDGSPIIRLQDGSLGMLLPWIPGSHVDYRSPRQRYQAVSTVAAMHASTMSMAAKSNPHLLPGGTLKHKITQKRKALHQVWMDAKQECRDLDTVEYDVFNGCERAYQTIRQIEVGMDPTACVFCHRDLAPHNLIRDPKGDTVSLIDFDLSGFDDPFLDVMQMVNHFIFTGALQPGDLYRFVGHYTRAFPCPDYRVAILWELLRFPDVLLRTLIEWAKTEFQPSFKTRIRASIQREQIRTKVLRLDNSRWRQGPWLM